MSRDKMSAVDTAWLRMDSPHNLMMIVGVWIFDRPLDVPRLRKRLASHFLKHKRFRQKAVLDATGAWWQTDRSFDLDHHLLEHALAAPGGDTALKAFVAELAAQPLEADRPLWQFHVVTGYGVGDALVTRIHHCIADGIALVAVMLGLTETHASDVEPDDAPEEDEPSAAESNPWRPYLEPITRGTIKAINATGTAWSKSLEVLVNPDKLADYARVGVQLIKDATRLALMPEDTATSLKGKPGLTKAVAWNAPLPLAEVRAVGRALDASINDVLLSSVAGALRTYLVEGGEEVAPDCELRAMVPVNLRPIEDALTLGNRFGLVPLSLPVGIANPVVRLREVHRRMEELKTGYQAVLAFALLGAVGMAPRPVQSQVLEFMARKGTAVMTNVPGPQQKLYIAGAGIERIMFWVPQSGDIGLGVSILSYNGGVQFGVISDARLTPNPDRIIAAFAPEFDKLVKVLALVPHELLVGDTLDPQAVDRALATRETRPRRKAARKPRRAATRKSAAAKPPGAAAKPPGAAAKPPGAATKTARRSPARKIDRR